MGVEPPRVGRQAARELGVWTALELMMESGQNVVQRRVMELEPGTENGMVAQQAARESLIGRVVSPVARIWWWGRREKETETVDRDDRKGLQRSSSGRTHSFDHGR